jgi:hypothetical protein
MTLANLKHITSISHKFTITTCECTTVTSQHIIKKQMLPISHIMGIRKGGSKNQLNMLSRYYACINATQNNPTC